MSVADLLRRVPLFAALDDLALQLVASRCVARAATRGTLLFAAGEVCRGLYIVESGRVRIFRTSPDGREQVLHVEGPGRPIAELPLVDGGVYPASAMTMEEARLVFLARADFERLYRSSPDIADAIIRSLGRRLRHWSGWRRRLRFATWRLDLLCSWQGWRWSGVPPRPVSS